MDVSVPVVVDKDVNSAGDEYHSLTKDRKKKKAGSSVEQPMSHDLVNTHTHTPAHTHTHAHTVAQL